MLKSLRTAALQEGEVTKMGSVDTFIVDHLIAAPAKDPSFVDLSQDVQLPGELENRCPSKGGRRREGSRLVFEGRG